MKQFSLEEYLKNPSRQVVTRYGKRVRIICTDYKSRKPIIGLVKDKEENEENIFTFTKDGKLLENGEKSFVDLFFLPTKKEGWINLFKDEDIVYLTGIIHDSEEDARKAIKGDPDFITTIKIEWEE